MADDYNTERPVMTPWKITELEEGGDHMIATRNPFYWKVDPEGNQLPYIDKIVNDKCARRVSLRMLRDVEAQSFIDSFNEGLKNNTPEAQLNAMKPQVDALVATLKSIGEAKKGDVINFDFTPDGGTRITLNGQPKGNPIPGADFFAAVLRIWLGDKPADETLKKGMLGA